MYCCFRRTKGYFFAQIIGGEMSIFFPALIRNMRNTVTP